MHPLRGCVCSRSSLVCKPVCILWKTIRRQPYRALTLQKAKTSVSSKPEKQTEKDPPPAPSVINHPCPLLSKEGELIVVLPNKRKVHSPRPRLRYRYR